MLMSTAVSSGASFVLSSILMVLLFSGMQMYKVWLGSSQLGTILGGLVGSMLFMCTLTAVGNLESTLFGKSFQQKLIPEVVFSLTLSLIASALIHRVSTTTCLIFSLIALYYMNRISQETYGVSVQSTVMQSKKRK
ncbi:PREDICTED: protein KRTCAP2 homolog isoform X1 [Wasmannia auropunctata]|uniref:protein KRTCAP2 homolog isoform X1 n=1 Tax=Wasmannia auropunctata TaxID=64793 RepID=UPI0005EF4042|nr:PREDICTED: protein KRTCAP2 homolog isoform X1 [Wasmannia auropunctata]